MEAVSGPSTSSSSANNAGMLGDNNGRRRSSRFTFDTVDLTTAATATTTTAPTSSSDPAATSTSAALNPSISPRQLQQQQQQRFHHRSNARDSGGKSSRDTSVSSRDSSQLVSNLEAINNTFFDLDNESLTQLKKSLQTLNEHISNTIQTPLLTPTNITVSFPSDAVTPFSHNNSHNSMEVPVLRTIHSAGEDASNDMIPLDPAAAAAPTTHFSHKQRQRQESLRRFATVSNKNENNSYLHEEGIAAMTFPSENDSSPSSLPLNVSKSLSLENPGSTSHSSRRNLLISSSSQFPNHVSPIEVPPDRKAISEKAPPINDHYLIATEITHSPQESSSVPSSTSSVVGSSALPGKKRIFFDRISMVLIVFLLKIFVQEYILHKNQRLWALRKILFVITMN